MGKLKEMFYYKPCQDGAIDLSQCCSPNQPIKHQRFGFKLLQNKLENEKLKNVISTCVCMQHNQKLEKILARS
jgi:hypothetical protein